MYWPSRCGCAPGDGKWKPIDLQAIPDIDTRQINLLRLLQGSWPPNDRQIVVDGYNLKKLPVGVGGSIELELPLARPARCS